MLMFKYGAACIFNALDVCMHRMTLPNPRKKEKGVDKTWKHRFDFVVRLECIRQTGQYVCAWRERLNPSNSDVLSLSV